MHMRPVVSAICCAWYAGSKEDPPHDGSSLGAHSAWYQFWTAPATSATLKLVCGSDGVLAAAAAHAVSSFTCAVSVKCDGSVVDGLVVSASRTGVALSA
eukprot:4025557-Prymnesium_polylepis.1